MSACTHPDVMVMDYRKGFASDEGGQIPMVNRICRKCYQHWFGPEEGVVEYTRAQWDAWISTTFEEEAA